MDHQSNDSGKCLNHLSIKGSNQKKGKKIQCDICSKVFKISRLLTAHKWKHTGVKPFVCEICNRGYTTTEKLKCHTRTHSGERPFKCDICSKSFQQLSILKEHKRRHTDDKPFKCKMCSKQYIKRIELTEHERSHTGENPFQCDMCDKSFRHSNSLNYHKRTHHVQNSLQVCEMINTELDTDETNKTDKFKLESEIKIEPECIEEEVSDEQLHFKKEEISNDGYMSYENENHFNSPDLVVKEEKHHENVTNSEIEVKIEPDEFSDH